MRKTGYQQKLRKIKMLAMDVDGVLTDGCLYYGTDGINEFKKFSVYDGMGIRLLHSHGIKTAIITAKITNIVSNRAKMLNITEVYQGVDDKIKALEEIMNKHGLDYDEIAYVGDDLNDIPVLKVVGFSASVPNGVERVRTLVDYVTEKKGGEGAIREIAELILNTLEHIKAYKS